MKNKEMNQLADEAVYVTQELGDIVFIGAIAVYLHTKSGRQSRDLDFAIATEISDEDLMNKGYRIYNGKKYTPRNIKIDIYSQRDIDGVTIKDIITTAKTIERRRKTIKIASLAVLVLLKYNANRSQDHEDLREIATLKYNEIDWELLRSLINDELKYTQVKNTIVQYRELS